MSKKRKQRAALSYDDFTASKWGVTKGQDLSRWELSLLNAAMGMAAEAGEVLDLVKKHIFHGHPFFPLAAKLEEEMGDVRFYQSRLLRTLGLSLEAVEANNVKKLTARYKGRLTPEESLKRKK